jgi:hypothetical protein
MTPSSFNATVSTDLPRGGQLIRRAFFENGRCADEGLCCCRAFRGWTAALVRSRVQSRGAPVNETSYVDFDLLIERAGRKCRARVLASPAGSTTPIEFPVPIRDETLQIFILTVGRPRQGVRRIDSPIEQEVKDLGARLYRSVFREQIRDCLKTSETEARRQGVGLRLRLHLDGGMANLPWEFLFDEAKESFLSLSRMTPIVRYLEIDDIPMPLKLDPPLRVLGVIASPSDYPKLDVDGEWTRLKAALSSQVKAGIVELQLLSPATVDELLQVLQRGTYHVLHFIGHGGFRESTDEGVLLFEDELGASRQVTGEELGILLQDHPSLRLVVLNSCEGARSDIGDPFSGTAQSLVRRRIPTVIAMQFEITDAAALKFSQAFYAALASNYPIDAAIAESRKSIRLTGNAFEWGTPVLYMLSQDGRVFELPKDAERKAREALEQDRTEQDRTEQERAEQEHAEHERAERERAEQDRVEQERAERERAEQDRVEQERAERERAEQDRVEQERAERERAEKDRVEQERAERTASRFVIASSISVFALIVGAFGTWGTSTVNELNAFQRSVGLTFGEPPAPTPPDTVPWFASVGLLLVVVAAAIAVAAVRRQRPIVVVLGVIVVLSTVLFSWHFYFRAKHNSGTYKTTSGEHFISSVGWGEWITIAAGLAIVITALLASRRSRGERIPESKPQWSSPPP